MRALLFVAAGAAGLLLGGSWCAAAASVLAAAALGAVRIARPPVAAKDAFRPVP
jgi:hypothetical protein